MQILLNFLVLYFCLFTVYFIINVYGCVLRSLRGKGQDIGHLRRGGEGVDGFSITSTFCLLIVCVCVCVMHRITRESVSLFDLVQVIRGE